MQKVQFLASTQDNQSTHMSSIFYSSGTVPYVLLPLPLVYFIQCACLSLFFPCGFLIESTKVRVFSSRELHSLMRGSFTYIYVLKGSNRLFPGIGR